MAVFAGPVPLRRGLKKAKMIAMRAIRSTPPAGRGSAGKNSAGSRYEVLDRVGEGTVYVVYKVRERGASRVFALKALKGAFAKNPRFVTSLLEAIRSSVACAHPRLACVEETGEEEGTPFIVSEWLPGGSLEERLRRAPFGRAEALSFTRQIAEGLDALHRSGLTHGDLRPRQIMLAADGGLKLTDAGMYAAFAVAGVAISDIQQEAAYYLAPERSEGSPPSPTSDLYSLGVILYRMLTARVPFDGPSAISIAMRHRRDLPMLPSQWNTNCPEDLQAIALRLLEKDPQARYASAAELLAEIGPRATSAAPSVPTRPSVNANHPFEIEPDSKTAAVGAVVGGAATGAAVVGATAASAAIAAANLAPAAVGATTTGAAAAIGGAAAGTANSPSRRRLPGPDDRHATNDAAVQDDTPPVDPLDDGAPALDEKAARKKQRRREALGFVLSIFWLIIAIGLLGGIIYGGFYFWKQETPREVKVANYINKSRPEAERLLQRDGLRLVVASEVYDRKRPANTVIKGEPLPGKTVRTGRDIYVTVSKGDEPIKMPDLTELDLQRARQIISRGGMKLGQVSTQYHDTVPKGYVCSQYPEPGESFTRADPISLIVSQGPQPTGDDSEEDPLPPPPTQDPSIGMEDESTSPVTSETAPPPSIPVVSRTVAVRVAIPTDGEAQEVRVVVQDMDGERTVYRRTHAPGDLLDEAVRVKREQGTTATVRVYVNDTLLQELTA
jgi:serine/threonine-protein kinase